MTNALPITTAARLVADLGDTVARVVAGGDRLECPVERVAIYDRDEALDDGPGTALLGVGVKEPGEVRDLILRTGEAGGVALLVREPVPADDAVLAAVRESGVALLEVSRAVSWMQLASLVGSRLDGPGKACDEGPVYPAGDLPGLANAIGALLGTPVTIEDRSCRVLAFSAGEQDADEGRRSTVLGQQVPQRYRRGLADKGVFRELYRSAGPVYVPEPADGCLPRLAVAVRAGAEVLGSLWAVVRDRPDEQALRSFADCADAVALELLRQRSAARAGDRAREEAAATMLDDPHQAAALASTLGLDDHPCCVVAIGVEPEQHGGVADRVRCTAEVQRIAAAFTLYLSAVYTSAVGTAIGDVVYGVVPSPVGDDTAAERVVSGFLHRMGCRAGLRAGIGRVAASPAELARSRADAEAVLDILSDTDRAERYSTWHAVRVDLMLRGFAEMYGQQAHASGPVANLIAHDDRHGTDYTGTVDAYLTAFGDVAKAAAALRIHQNTFRYRLGRICGLGGPDLTDPDARIAAILDLRAARLS